MTIQQTDSVAYKLKPRSFYKSAHFWVNLVDFHPQCDQCLTTMCCTHVLSVSVLYDSRSFIIFFVFLLYLSYILLMILSLCKHKHFLLSFLCRHGYLLLFLWSIDIYSSRYSPVSLCFTDWLFFFFLLKSLSKMQPKPSLGT